jgi:hypothetical protein
MKTSILLLALVLAAPSVAHAEWEQNATKLIEIKYYPDNPCDPPGRPISNIDDATWRCYLRALERYRQCILNYIRAAEQDIKTIEDKIDAAVNEYNSFLKRQMPASERKRKERKLD